MNVCAKITDFELLALVHPCDKVDGPCKNGGVCEREEDGFQCKCGEDFAGDTCEKKGKRSKAL